MKFFIFLLFIGGIAALWWYFSKNKTKKLKDEKILERWAQLFPDAQGRSEKIFIEVRKEIDKLNPPHVLLREKNVAGGVIKGQEKRKMLIAENNKLAGLIMYVGARDYGNQLLVSWYLVQEATWLDRLCQALELNVIVTIIFLPLYLIVKLIERVTKRVSLENMGVFETEELSAYTGAVHSAVINASRMVAEEINFDFSKVDTKSRGFLNLA
ncbi:MAG: hypothetical protein V1770_01520 [bacterium]